MEALCVGDPTAVRPLRRHGPPPGAAAPVEVPGAPVHPGRVPPSLPPSACARPDSPRGGRYDVVPCVVVVWVGLVVVVVAVVVVVVVGGVAGATATV